jgi:Leucine-rich repeat (LRR) protein
MSKTPEHIVEKIRKARAEGETELSLWNQNLSEIPGEIFEQDSFEEIWLDENQIRSVPARIAQLKKLRWLVLFGNPLEDIADVPGLVLDFSIYQKFKKHLSPAHLAGVKFTSAEITQSKATSRKHRPRAAAKRIASSISLCIFPPCKAVWESCAKKLKNLSRKRQKR